MTLIPKQRTEYPVPPFEELTMIIFARPGMGKTKFSAGCPNTLFIATEPGQDFTNAAVAKCGSWNDFISIIDEIIEKRRMIMTGNLPVAECPYNNFTVDITDNLAGFCRDYICHQRGLAYPPQNDFGKTWSSITNEWKSRIDMLLSLGNVRFISHCNTVPVEVEDSNGMIVEIDHCMPTFSGSKTAQFLDGIVNAMGYLFVDKNGHHCITFRKTASIGAKDRTNILSSLGVIDIDWSLGKKSWDIVSEAYRRRAEELGKKIISKKERRL